MILPAPNRRTPGLQHRARLDAAHPRLPGRAAAADDAEGGLRAGERGWLVPGRAGMESTDSSDIYIYLSL